MKCTELDSANAIDLAIETVGRAQDSLLTNQLVDFLMGDHDGQPKVWLQLDI